jgi:hypothetical protein
LVCHLVRFRVGRRGARGTRCLVLAAVLLVTVLVHGRDHQEHQRQHGEDQSLNQADENLQPEEGN